MKKALKICAIVIGAIAVHLVAFVVVSVFLGSLPGMLWIHLTNKDIKNTKNEIFSYVLEYKTTSILDSNYNAAAFYYDTNGFLDYGFDQGYYFSPNDTYQNVYASTYSQSAHCSGELTDAKRYKKGYRTEARYYTEKICDNWYYFECPIDD